MSDDSRLPENLKPRLQRLHPDAWSVIATRPRSAPPTGTLTWWPVDNPPAALGIGDAHRYAARGFLLIANRHREDRVELVVKPARNVFD